MAATAISCSYADSNVIEGFAHGNDTANGAVRWYRTENGVQFVSGSGGYAEQKTNSRYRFVTDGGYAEFGPQNASFNHIMTDRPKNYFNTQISVDGGIIASYDEDMQLRRADSTDDMIEIEASETKVFGDAVERIRIGSYGLKVRQDNYRLFVGAGDDWSVRHDGTNTHIINDTGHLHVSQSAQDKDIEFSINDGGNIETPMKIVGSTGNMLIAQPSAFQFANDQRIFDDGGGGLKVGAESHKLQLFGGSTEQQVRVLFGGRNGSEKFRMSGSGDFHADGDVIAASTTVSDKRLKDNVEIILRPLDKVKELRGVSFDWNKGSRKGQKDIGLIAQEVEKVLPELVREKKMVLIDDKEYLTVDYDKMVAVLVEAVKEQQVQIEELKEDIKELKK